jgi:hypothetical protein
VSTNAPDLTKCETVCHVAVAYLPITSSSKFALKVGVRPPTSFVRLIG